MYASTRASSSASTSPSVFSLASCSSASSIGDQFEYDAPAVAPTPMMPVAKAASIHLPLRLPARPNGQRDVNWSQLVLDGELAGHPVGFILASLRAMGSELHKLAHTSRVHIPAVPEMPSHLAVEIPPTTLPRPTHVLAIGSDDSSRKLLMPVHGLLWAASSPALAALSSQGDTSLDAFLPVMELHLPSALAVPLLQKWIYLASSESLLSLLLPAPPRNAVKRGSLTSLLNPTPASYSHSISSISSSILLARTEVLHGLWQNVIALEMGDVELWRTMSGAWEILVGALALQEARRREVARGRAQGR